MNSLTAGAGIAVLVAGWPLYSLVSSGNLTLDSALLRGGVVAGACAFGVTLVVRLALGYEAQVEAERKRRLHDLFSDMEAVVDHGLGEDGQATDAPAGRPSATRPTAPRPAGAGPTGARSTGGRAATDRPPAARPPTGNR